MVDEDINNEANFEDIPSLTDEEKEKYLHQIWLDLPIVKQFDNRMWEIREQPHRGLIIRAMTSGLDMNQNEDEAPKRYIFSGRELHTYLESELGKKIKISNVYHHLNKLQEAGVIDELATLMDGKRKTRYFGRIAKIYVFIEDPEITMNSKDNKLIAEFLNSLNPDIEKEKFYDLLKLKIKFENYKYNKIMDWISENHKTLPPMNFNITSLIVFFRDWILPNTDSKLQDLSRLLSNQLGEILGIDYPDSS